MIVIPAIDILNNRVARLKEGDYARSTFYKKDPVEQAEYFYTNGFKRIHIVDLTASKVGGPTTKPLLTAIKKRLPVTIEFGGGVRNMRDVEELREAGVDKIIIGTLAVKEPETVLRFAERFGPECFIIAADVLNECVRIKGWTEETQITIYDHIRRWSIKGFKEYLCTDISKDGMLKGPNITLYQSIGKAFPGITLLASGGVSCEEDLVELKKAGMPAAIVGRAIYDGTITMEELKKYAG